MSCISQQGGFLHASGGSAGFPLRLNLTEIESYHQVSGISGRSVVRVKTKSGEEWILQGTVEDLDAVRAEWSRAKSVLPRGVV